jgi:putative toxin-antitoxin system antitoxin component (TIGR02293 family)
MQTATHPAAREKPVAKSLTAGVLDWSAIDAWILSMFADKALRNQVRRLEKVELESVWILTERALHRHMEEHPQTSEPLEVHRRLREGLSGESLLVSSSMFLSSVSEAEDFFELSFKTIKSKLGKSLDTAASERAMRAARVTTAAAEVLGSFDAARKYMHTKNFALGGSTPVDLLKTSEGERMVLNELQAQAEGGPL